MPLSSTRRNVVFLLLVLAAALVLVDFGAGPKAATNQLTAAVVTARFSPVTNRIEEAVAERQVVLDQWKASQIMHATGDHAVYTAANDRATLTGAPFARTQSYLLTDSDLIIWEPKTNRLHALGHYILTPLKSQTNQPPVLIPAKAAPPK